MELIAETSRLSASNDRRILGIDFFGGTAVEAIRLMRNGGLLVVPAAPALKDLPTNRQYREALLHADLAITDSSFMVMVWNLVQHDHLRRLSGLEYLRSLLKEDDVRQPGNTLWIMPGEVSAERNVAWLQGQGIEVPADHVYVAPFYGGDVKDEELLERITRLGPRHVIVTLGGGTQERLGLYVKRHLPYLPAIHCIGAAIAFLSGDQVHIPVWADKLCLGWLIRSVSDPLRFVPRYWQAQQLLGLIVRHRHRLPPLQGTADAGL